MNHLTYMLTKFCWHFSMIWILSIVFSRPTFVSCWMLSLVAYSGGGKSGNGLLSGIFCFTDPVDDWSLELLNLCFPHLLKQYQNSCCWKAWTIKQYSEKLIAYGYYLSKCFNGCFTTCYSDFHKNTGDEW